MLWAYNLFLMSDYLFLVRELFFLLLSILVCFCFCVAHACITLLIGFQVALNVFHQTFCIPSIPGVVQFFLSIINCPSSFSSTLGCSAVVTFAFNLLCIFFIHVPSGVIVLSFHTPVQNCTNLSMAGVFPVFP